MTTPSFYKRPDRPKTTLTLLSWLIFEPMLLERFDRQLTRKTRMAWLVKGGGWIVFFSLMIYLAGAAMVVWGDLPHRFPDMFRADIAQTWASLPDGLARYGWWMGETMVGLIQGLAAGMALSVAGGVSVGLVAGFAGGLIFVLIFVLAIVLASVLSSVIAYGLTFGLVSGAAAGLVAGLTIKMEHGVIYGGVSGLVIGLVAGMNGGWGQGLFVGGVNGLVFSLAFFAAYLRLMFYPFYAARSFFFSPDLLTNPYLKDGVIRLPLPRLDNTLVMQGWMSPDMGFDLARFLLEYRPFQRSLAMKMIHAATAGTWYRHPLDPDRLVLPQVNDQPDMKVFLPDSRWTVTVGKAKRDLSAALKTTHRHFRREAFSQFHTTLAELERLTLLQGGGWRDHYLIAIRKWQKESENKLADMDLELQHAEPISPNIYRVGESLSPQDFGRETFVGREDVRDELDARIQTAATLPTFLLQGQRRVGKTSLLNFLPDLLGSRFLVIAEDCQGKFGLADIFLAMKKKAEKMLHLKSSAPFPECPLPAWQAFEAYFSDLAQREDRKIILCFDEYEDMHKLIQKLGEEGALLLGAMRSFSQKQNQVVFLFTGMHLFPDLGEPDFGRYFVHALRVKVDYLKEEDATRLITRPYEGFSLVYSPEVVDRMIDLTAGHPALLQHICSEIVNRANINAQKEVGPADLAAAVLKVTDRSNAVMARFWIDFCQGTLKETVREIMATGASPHQADLLRLLDYGFIARAGSDHYRLRVPLFHQWIDLHGGSF